MELFWAGRESKEHLANFKVIHITHNIIFWKAALIIVAFCPTENALTFFVFVQLCHKWLYNCIFWVNNFIYFFIFFTAFGFCEYKEPESTLRALRLLHDLQIGDKNLLVKVDAKTKAQLDEWKAKKKTANGVRLQYKVYSISFCGYLCSVAHCFISFRQDWRYSFI